MIARFADTSYYIALLNPDDDLHAQAVAVTDTLVGQVITSEWVLAELGGRLFAPRNRREFFRFVEDLRGDADIVIVGADKATFEAGLALYGRRLDKEWSVVDCISFNIMNERGISEALSTDHHFAQAGFKILLK
jgi:uncharacterized protein